MPSYRNKQFVISVVIVTRNAGALLERALQSVFTQSYPHVEVIVVDGDSTDNTLEIIRRHEGRLKAWLSEPDDGLYDAMNKGVKLAKGDWIYFLGADDVLVNCLDKVRSFLRDKNTVYYGDVYLPSKNKTYAGEFKWHTLVSKNINHQSIFYPRQVFEQYAYNLNYPILADYDLNLRLWGEGKFRFEYMPAVVAVHNDGGISHEKQDEAFLRDKPALVNRYFGQRIALRAGWHRLRGLGGSLIRALSGKKQ